MTQNVDLNNRPDFDKEITELANYVLEHHITSSEAFYTARYCLIDALGCAALALRYPECTKLLGPIIPGTQVPNGVHVPGTSYRLDPVQGAFNIGTLIRWLDYNDTWLGAEYAHPSDNLGAILSVADYVSQINIAKGRASLTMHDVLCAMIKAYEIQGIYAIENSFNKRGLDHVVLVKVASAAIAAMLLGASKEQIQNAISHAWVDGQSLRTYRQAPNTGSRKSWAAGDATARGVRLAMMAMQGEMGYPSVLSAKKWGFYDALFNGESFKFQREFGSYVIENVLFKISYPAEFHSQTALECAVKLHNQVIHRLDEIERIELSTHESAIRIISKTGPLHNPADRDHCLQYIVAIGLLKGNLTADDYEHEAAKDPRIDILREKMVVSEDKRYSEEYHYPDKRSIANAMQIFFKDGSATEKVEIEYPIGHRFRREEGIPFLLRKSEANLLTRFPQKKADEISKLLQNHEALMNTSVTEFMELLVI